MGDDKLIELQELAPPEFADVVPDDAEDDGELGGAPSTAGPRPAPGTGRARRDPPTAVATVTPLLIELEDVDLFPLRPWELALPPERRPEMDRLGKGDRWRAMVRDALDRDMAADDARAPADRHYDFPALFTATYGQLRARGDAAAERQAVMTALATAARRLWADEALTLSTAQLAGHLGVGQRELADLLGWTPERLAAADRERRARGISPRDIPPDEEEEPDA